MVYQLATVLFYRVGVSGRTQHYKTAYSGGTLHLVAWWCGATRNYSRWALFGFNPLNTKLPMHRKEEEQTNKQCPAETNHILNTGQGNVLHLNENLVVTRSTQNVSGKVPHENRPQFRNTEARNSHCNRPSPCTNPALFYFLLYI